MGLSKAVCTLNIVLTGSLHNTLAHNRQRQTLLVSLFGHVLPCLSLIDAGRLNESRYFGFNGIEILLQARDCNSSSLWEE